MPARHLTMDIRHTLDQPVPSLPSPNRSVFEGPDCLIPELKHIGYDLFTQADTTGLTGHVHPEGFECCYLVRGTVTWWVGEEILEVEPGDLYLTWPGELHGGVDGAMHPCELYWVQVAIPDRGTTLDLSASETRHLYEALHGLKYRKCPGPPAMKHHYRRILNELAAPTPLSPALVRGTLRLLLGDLLAAFQQQRQAPSTQREYSPRILRAIRWLEGEMGHSVSIEDAAAVVGLRPSHFRQQFRRETGFSPIEFLTRLRIREAKRRLIETRADVTDIAFDLGFSSSQYFATVFRKHTGLSPTQFRRRRA